MKTKEEADYHQQQNPIEPARCGTCTMFKPESAGCTLVRGWISSTAVCKFWEGK